MSVAAPETTGAPLEQASQARTIQLALASALSKDVVKVWPQLDPKNLDGTFQSWLQQMTQLINRYRGMSALAAGIYYRDTREHALQIPTPANLIKTAGDAPAEWLQKGLGYSGPGLLSNPTAQPGTALSVTQGTAQRMVADAGRSTIIDTTQSDAKAVGWYRQTDGRPCAFCALLASRGAVYKSDSFERSNARFDGTGVIKVHNDCGCMPGAMFKRDQPLPPLSQVADSLYTDHVSKLPNGQRLAAFRELWNQHLASLDAQ